MFGSFISGLGLNAGLIISIGPQNASLIRLGILKKYPILLATIFILCDACLLVCGVFSANFLMSMQLMNYLSILSVCLLSYLTFMSFKRCFKPNKSSLTTQQKQLTLLKVIILGFALSLLNPFAIFETIVIIGGSSATFQFNDRYYFIAGAFTTSLFWFYGIAFFSQKMSNFFQNKSHLKGLEFILGSILLLVTILQIVKLVNR